MPAVISVKFSYATRDLWFDPADTGAVEGDHVICATERGTEIGLATADAREVEKSEVNRRTDGAPLKRVLRVATDEDLDRAVELAERGEAALPTFRSFVSKDGLDMKPVGVEYLFGGEKVVCYFAAEERVDFRQLVRDLSRELHERVDMRQIGVREEAALMGGYAHCGQELCCARFGSGFEPVSIRMAKEQDLPLNSNKISGACGRLMCCLRYEFEAYRDFKQRAPKKNAVIQTPLGTAKIVEYDTPKEQLALRLENGKQIRVPLAEMQASPAACKKSEDLGCPCRPDTVTRSTLEKLQSPEIRAALEEIDRKNGLVPEESFESADLFVEERGGGRRRRNKGGNKGQGAGGQQGPGRGAAEQRGREDAQVPEGEQAGSKRRRRRKTVEISGEAAENLPGQGNMSEAKQSAPGEGRRSRRRRHHVEGEDGAQGSREQQGREQGGSRGGERGRSEERDGRVRRGDEDGALAEEAPRRRRRRPGDKGGMAAEQQREARGGREGREGERAGREDGHQAREPRRRREGGEGSGAGAPRHLRQEADGREGARGAAEDGGAPKRRRRRHRRSGEGGNEGGAAGGTPSGE